MPANVYHFVNRWHVPHPPEEVWEVLARPWEYPAWWGRVYLRAERVDGGGEPRVGTRVALVTKGWLPYQLRWTAETTALERPSLIKIRATGDLATDESRWVLTAEGEGTRAMLYWNPRADKPLVRLLSPVLKPLFRSNHVWAMNEGERRIGPYVAARRAARR